MPRLQHFLVTLCLVALITPASSLAESTKQGNQQQQTSNIGSMPTRGMSMDEVKQHFGQPEKRFAPVGNPPISRWEYDGLMVYFEDQYVIHSVAIDDKPK